VGPEDLLFVLVSGGGSALFEAPEEGVSLRDVAWLTGELMKRDADMVELNAVRKRLSRVKGGKLLTLVETRQVVSLIMSDVVGDRLDTVASGPTAQTKPCGTTPWPCCRNTASGRRCRLIYAPRFCGAQTL
jgi:glycerate 2-kinase